MRLNLASVALLTGLLISANLRLASATPFTLRTTFSNPNQTSGSSFGSSLGVSGGMILVGAPGEDLPVNNSGAVYLFNSDGQMLRRFGNPSPGDTDHFGNSFAVAGNTVIIGSYLDDTDGVDAGIAYVFDLDTGALLRTLHDPNAAPNKQFGSVVAAFGNKVLVSSPLDDTAGSSGGSVYVFDPTTGALLQTFVNPAIDAGLFGLSIAVAGNNILIGSPLADVVVSDGGGAYLYNGTTFDLIHTFSNPSAAASDQFGHFISAAGADILIGADGDDTTGSDAGAAYLFSGFDNSLLQTFYSPSPQPADLFGWGLSGFGDYLVLGGANTEAAYLYAKPGDLLQTLNGFASGDLFGKSIMSFGNNGILIGAPGGDAAYLYVSEVPEPSTICLTVLGLVGIIFNGRRGNLSEDGTFLEIQHCLARPSK